MVKQPSSPLQPLSPVHRVEKWHMTVLWSKGYILVVLVQFFGGRSETPGLMNQLLLPFCHWSREDKMCFPSIVKDHFKPLPFSSSQPLFDLVSIRRSPLILLNPTLPPGASQYKLCSSSNAQKCILDFSGDQDTKYIRLNCGEMCVKCCTRHLKCKCHAASTTLKLLYGK